MSERLLSWRMRGRLLLALVAICGLAVPGLAQTLRVQSGDHPGFSRLVIPIGAERTWTLTGEGRLWRLVVNPAVDGFDTTGVFDLIGRDRLASVSADDALTLTLGCDCTLEPYRFRDRYLVIDISEPADDALPRGEDDSAAERRAQAAAALPDLARLLTYGGGAPAPSTDARPSAARVEPVADIALEEAAAIMVEQLSRAAASGLLEAELGRPMSDGDPAARRPADEQIATIDEADMPDAPRAAPHPGEGRSPETSDAVEISRPDRSAPLPIRAETAFDVARHAHTGAEPQRPPLACSGQQLDIGQWADGAGVDHGLGDLRLALFDDRDRMLRAAAIDLARHYLFYGFGAEAEFWLSQIEDPPQTLIILARFLDGKEDARFPSVTDPLGCSGDELFWRYLTGSIDHPLSAEQVGAIQRYHAGLPTVLRDHLGPDLARQLAGDTHLSAARNVVETLARGGRLRPSALALLDLDLGIAPPSDAMRTVLDEALESDGAAPADTMAHALALDHATGQRPAPQRLVAAEALLRETPDGESRDALWREVVIAHAQNGEFDRAISMLERSRPFESDIQQDVITGLLENRLDISDTAGLSAIAHLFGPDWRATGSAAGRVRVAAIAHLQNAGLWRAAGALRNAQRTLILPAQDAPPLDDATTLANAWSRRDWSTLAERTNDAEQDLAMRMLAAPSPSNATPAAGRAAEEPPPDLAALSELVVDSRDLRATIMALIPSTQAR